MKIYSTKYALSKGIEEYEVDAHGTPGEYVYYRQNHVHLQFLMGWDAFLTLSDASRNAEERRLAKIASLKKQLAKLEKLIF